MQTICNELINGKHRLGDLKLWFEFRDSHSLGFLVSCSKRKGIGDTENFKSNKVKKMTTR